MASFGAKFISRSSLSSIKSALRSNASKSAFSRSATPSSSSSSAAPSVRRFSISSVLCSSLQDAVGAGMRGFYAAAAQCGGDGEADVMLEHHFEELPCALSGHIISKDLAIMAHCILTKWCRWDVMEVSCFLESSGYQFQGDLGEERHHYKEFILPCCFSFQTDSVNPACLILWKQVRIFGDTIFSCKKLKYSCLTPFTDMYSTLYATRSIIGRRFSRQLFSKICHTICCHFKSNCSQLLSSLCSST